MDREPTTVIDPLNPEYYRFGNTQVIDIVKHLSFCRGNAIKYLARAGAKDKETELQDLKKALWYIQQEIDRVNEQQQ